MQFLLIDVLVTKIELDPMRISLLKTLIIYDIFIIIIFISNFIN